MYDILREIIIRISLKFQTFFLLYDKNVSNEIYIYIYIQYTKWSKYYTAQS